MRSRLLSAGEARSYLASCVRTGENYGDRIAAQRALLPVTTEKERRAVSRYLAENGFLMCRRSP